VCVRVCACVYTLVCVCVLVGVTVPAYVYIVYVIAWLLSMRARVRIRACVTRCMWFIITWHFRGIEAWFVIVLRAVIRIGFSERLTSLRDFLRCSHNCWSHLGNITVFPSCSFCSETAKNMHRVNRLSHIPRRCPV